MKLKLKFKFMKLDNVRVRNKLLMLYILCVLFPIILTNLIFLNSITNSVKKRQIEQIDTSLERISFNIKKDIEDVLYLSNTIYTDRILNDDLEKKYKDAYEFYEIFNSYLRNALLKNIHIYKQIGAINIYTDNETIPESDGYQFINAQVRDNEWYQKISKAQNQILLTSYIENNNRFFSIIEKLNNNNFPGKRLITKVLKVDLMYSSINDLLKAEKLNGDLYLVNELGQIVVSTNSSYDSGKTDSFATFNTIGVSKNDFVISREFDNLYSLTGWKLIGVFEEKQIFDALKESRNYIILLAILNLLLATIVILLISKSFQVRLKTISNHMDKVGKQNFEVIRCEEGNDEIGELIREFNRMATKIQELIKNEYEFNIQKKNLELERKQAEINALQSQINPHFLFNTLESIRMRSVVKKESETAEIIKYLAKIFRRLILWGNDLVEVKDEIEFIENFLKIQKYRFGDKVNYEISVTEEALKYRIPKMTIQPFVENACVHGIEGIKGKGYIKLNIDASGECLNCIIEDNGTGIKEEVLQSIIKDMEHMEPTGGSVGIKNVYNRLRLFYGGNFAFNIESKESGGTRVSIKIPGKN